MKIDGINWIIVIIVALLLVAFLMLAFLRLPVFNVVNVIR